MNHMKNCEFNFFPANKAVSEIVLQQIYAIHKAAYNDSASMPEKEWEEDRRNGIGGSDVSAITGDSPFNNNWMLFLDKTGIAKRDLSENWFRLKYGHVTECLTAELFARKFSAIVLNETGMFMHPDFSFIRANLDRLAVLPTGELVILECKSTNPFGRTAWAEQVPIYYDWQGRQYLCVINAILKKANLPPVQKVYYSALYGNTEEDVIFRKVRLDQNLEDFMVEMEKEFWLEHVVPKKLPDFNGSGKAFKDMNLSYRLELSELSPVKEANESSLIALGEIAQSVYDTIDSKAKAITKLKEQIKVLEEESNMLKGSFVAMMHGSDTAILPSGVTANIASKATRSTDYSMLKELYPDAYALCVKEGQSTPSLGFKKPSTKKQKQKAAETAAKATSEIEADAVKGVA